MTDDKLIWVDKPDCSKGYPNAHMDRHEWRTADPRGPYRTCSFCGSMHPEDLLRVLDDERSQCLTTKEFTEVLKSVGPGLGGLKEKLPPITLEWADRKYGYPHKLYVTHNNGEGAGAWGKFYVAHLFELPDRTFQEVAVTLAAKTRVMFERDAVGTKWKMIQPSADN